ncbi:hypothetical protein JAAARDRAFT_31774 [Jaapia argillacea MUCL 33604]|uniref:DAGKc domain-containing protein n=1 Tax=Jaapia argillacea MUCL 33604 TaxID=933084 RepID=A0A067Q145_9AGAM|nr:hypothetical protein JAAARDRAFT_31774 [Jaapia argillacea MUCL 33604]
MDDSKHLRVVASGGISTFSYNGSTLVIQRLDKKNLDVPLRQVLWVQYVEQALEVHFLARKKPGAPLSLVKARGAVHKDDRPHATEWVEALMDAAYQGTKRNRHLKVLVNPKGGQGKAVSAFRKKVEPIFHAAQCSLDVTYTRHPKHAYALAKELSLDYDAVVTVSGDGLIHEVINGLAQHTQPRRALTIPIAPIPTGSGNGLSLNLLGIEDGFDLAAAALNVIKGRPMKTDLFSFTQNGNRHFSFMSQAVGLMADLDLGTESLRWMGDTRFLLGFLRGVLRFKPCPVTLSIKVAERDKVKMAEYIRSVQPKDDEIHRQEDQLDQPHDTLPPLKHSDLDEDWISLDTPLLYIYAGQGPYVGRDLMQFPVSLPDDGLIDVVAQELTSRGDMLKAMDEAEKGAPYWMEGQHYFKAYAYRVTPHSLKGCLAVDGEAYPFEEFQVEVHPKLATLLSPHGRYASEFVVPGR